MCARTISNERLQCKQIEQALSDIRMGHQHVPLPHDRKAVETAEYSVPEYTPLESFSVEPDTCFQAGLQERLQGPGLTSLAIRDSAMEEWRLVWYPVSD